MARNPLQGVLSGVGRRLARSLIIDRESRLGAAVVDRLQRVQAGLEGSLAAGLDRALRATGLNVQIVNQGSSDAGSAAPPEPASRGTTAPTPLQVMDAVQTAVVGASQVASGIGSGIEVGRDAARAAIKTAGGAARLASGVSTVLSGFFPQLTALGMGIPPAAPRAPTRRVSSMPAAKPRPTVRVRRVPLARAKSSLDMTRKSNARRPRSYTDLGMRQLAGLSPHEILLKVATLTLGKTLLGMLHSGARAQSESLQRSMDKLSQRQVLLLGMLPAQYIAGRMPQQLVADSSAPPTEATKPPAGPGAPARPDPPPAGGQKFRMRY